MPATDELDLLWQRVEEARRQWKSAHVKEADDPLTVDGSYALFHSVNGQRLAVKKYLRALQDFKSALAPPPEISISLREREVLKLIASGKTSKQIAAKLGISFRTAIAHRYHLHAKLKVHKAADLVKAALRMGLIEL